MTKKRIKNVEETVNRMLAGDRRSASRLITAVEDQTEKSTEIMKLVYPHSGKSMIVGITGSGGSGKSSLIDRLIGKFRGQGKRVGVAAVDPSSPFSGGALLGDRIRFQSHTLDEGVYVRSMGSRNYLGGLARATNDAVRIMEAMGQDVVIVETLGTGQDEVDIIHVAQTCVLVLTPGMGDEIQAMKAGIMEIADIIVLNKADLDGANSCLRNLEATVYYGLGDGVDKWVPRVIPTVAMAPNRSDLQGIDELVKAIQAHATYLHQGPTLDQVKARRAEQELALIFKDEVEKFIFQGLKGTGKKQQYIRSILCGETNPYAVVEEVLATFLKLE
jgi:GTPase